jgi:hypothetical protein
VGFCDRGRLDFIVFFYQNYPALETYLQHCQFWEIARERSEVSYQAALAHLQGPNPSAAEYISNIPPRCMYALISWAACTRMIHLIFWNPKTYGIWRIERNLFYSGIFSRTQKTVNLTLMEYRNWVWSMLNLLQPNDQREYHALNDFMLDMSKKPQAYKRNLAEVAEQIPDVHCSACREVRHYANKFRSSHS